jgi:hypothetical protein
MEFPTLGPDSDHDRVGDGVPDVGPRLVEPDDPALFLPESLGEEGVGEGEMDSLEEAYQESEEKQVEEAGGDEV